MYEQGEAPQSTVLKTQGREVLVPEAAVHARVAKFSFEDLCCKPLGAADYICIAKAFPTVFLTAVPLLTIMERNEVHQLGPPPHNITCHELTLDSTSDTADRQTRRLIVLIDTLYNHNVKLLMTAATAAHYIFSPEGHDANGKPLPA